MLILMKDIILDTNINDMYNVNIKIMFKRSLVQQVKSNEYKEEKI